jgi:DNA-binding CsgD family transcriptional regulator
MLLVSLFKGCPAPCRHPFATAWLLAALVDRGDVVAAERLLTARRADGHLPPELPTGPLLWSRGRLRRAQGNHAAAADDFFGAGAILHDSGMVGPGPLTWRADAARAVQAIGDVTRARALAAEDLDLARRFGAPRAIGVALRTTAAVDPSPEDRIELLRASVDALATSQAELEYARSLAELGSALRRAKNPVAARDPLRLALDIAHRCGARALERYAQAELLTSGARPRRHRITGRDALTPGERRVADLAIDGFSNREIAQQLFLTPKTVETHLGHTYQKLGIRRRGDLASAVGVKPVPVVTGSDRSM